MLFLLKIFLFYKILDSICPPKFTCFGRRYIEIKKLFAQLLLFSRIRPQRVPTGEKKWWVISEILWNEKSAAKSYACKWYHAWMTHNSISVFTWSSLGCQDILIFVKPKRSFKFVSAILFGTTVFQIRQYPKYVR